MNDKEAAAVAEVTRMLLREAPPKMRIAMMAQFTEIAVKKVLQGSVEEQLAAVKCLYRHMERGATQAQIAMAEAMQPPLQATLSDTVNELARS